MSLDAIDIICQAEEAAAALKAETIAKTKRAAEAAHEEGRQALVAIGEKIDAELKAKKAQVQLEADMQAKSIFEQSAEQAAVLRKNAEARFDEAAEYIVERIVNG